MKKILTLLILSSFLFSCKEQAAEKSGGHDNHSGHDHVAHDHVSHEHDGECCDNEAHQHQEEDEEETAEQECPTGCGKCKDRQQFKLKAPNNGTLIKLGGQAALLELVLNKQTGQLKVYVYDGLAEEQKILEQKTLILKLKSVSLVLKANSEGVFSLTNKLLKGVDKFKATTGPLAIDGLPFDGTPILFPQGN